MKKTKIIRRIAMLISLVMLITSTVNTTYGFIVVASDPLVNIFQPEAVKVNGLAINKTIEHSLGEEYKIPENITFDFQVELGAYYANAGLNTTQGEMTADTNGNLTVMVTPGTTFAIAGLNAGTQVKVTELATSLAGFAPKDNVTTKEVTIGADGNASADFVNLYTPEPVKGDSISLQGVKILEGRDWQSGDTFSFQLEQQNGDAWMELGTKTVTYSAENGEFNKFDFSDVFDSLTFEKVGTYHFRIREIKGDLANVDYDETINRFTVKVTDVDMDGKLEINTVQGTENAEITTQDGKHIIFVTFNNTFVPPVIPKPSPVTLDIAVNKVVHNTGDASVGPEGFEFVLENVQTQEKQALQSDVNGKAYFSLTFTDADAGNTYTYKLSETNAGAEGMLYDSTVYEITIRVNLDAAYQLCTTVTVNGESVETAVAEFQNTYHMESTAVPPTDDNGNVTFWFIMMFVSGLTLLLLVLAGKKKNTPEDILQ